MEIYLVRHTRPGVPEGTCYGRTDVALDEADFEKRLPAIADHLPRGMPFYSSPATRCSRLAGALASATAGVLAGIDARLHEMHFGDWEGRPWDALPRHETEAWTRDIVNRAPPNGENFAAMWERVTAFYCGAVEAAHAAGHERIAIVGHAGSLKVLVLRTLGMAPAQYGLADVAQGRVSRIDAKKTADGQWFERLMFLNR